MKKLKDWRLYVILILIILCGAAVFSRLFFLQILKHKFLQAQALGQQVGFSEITGPRGEIFAQSGQEVKSLAINRDSWTISVNIKDVADKEVFATDLSKVLDDSKDHLLADLNSNDSYVVLKKNLSTEQLKKIKGLNLKGLSWQNNPVRFYPQSRMASQDIGFLGGSGSGQYGLEGYYEDILKGKNGILEQQAGLNSVLENDNNISLDGSDIYLTIDYNIQLETEALLKKTRDKLDIRAGQIIVLKPDTGKIVALANYPSFDPNQYGKENDLEIFQNSATQKLFEPGSILKPFTMAAAINEGKITSQSTYVDEGFLKIGPETIHNFANEVYGKRTMTEVLENSINTGAVFAQQQIDHKTFWNYVEKFGFTEKTGIDLQGEVYSRNESLRIGHDVEYATASFGQGIELTPMQVARAFCALANGGKLVKPYIVEKIVNGQDQSYTKPEVSNPIISQETVSQIRTMLIDVVDKGFNSVAKVPGYYLAGKTGTAQIPLKNGKGYEPDNNTIQSFVGYGPALNPQFVVLVKLDNPKVPKSALSAVPVFKELAQYILNYWKIPPDYDATKTQEAKKPR